MNYVINLKTTSGRDRRVWIFFWKEKKTQLNLLKNGLFIISRPIISLNQSHYIPQSLYNYFAKETKSTSQFWYSRLK
jgi:hypothetical protein